MCNPVQLSYFVGVETLASANPKSDPMSFNLIAGAAAVVALFVPVLLILAGRLYTNRSLLVLFVYYLFTGVYNLMDLDVIPATALFKRHAGVAFNYLDTPMMLVVLLFFCNQKWKRNLVLLALALFMVFEIIIAFRFGLAVQSSVYLLGPGTVLILLLSIFFFSHYGKICIVQGRGLGKTLMLVSIIFFYTSFLILYYLHYLLHTPAEADEFLIYYISVFIAAVVMSTGLVSIIRRARAIREWQLTRKELALFFDSQA